MTRRSPLFPNLTLALALGACHGPKAPESLPSTPIELGVAVAHTEPLAVTYRTSGTLRGRSTAVLTSKTTGYVQSVRVRGGDSVPAGALLVELEAQDSKASVARARAGLARALQLEGEATFGLQVAKVAVKAAHSAHARVAQLYAERVVSPQAYEDSEARLRSEEGAEQGAEARLAVAAASIEEAKAALAQAEAALTYAKITAPFAGRIIERRVDPGSLATPSMPLLVIQEQGVLRVEAAVEESQSAHLRLGDSASVELDRLPEPVVGKIVELVPSIDVASRTFIAKIELPANLPPLQPGGFVRVSFQLGTEPRLVVPKAAVRLRGSLERVFVIEDGVAHLRLITRGESQGAFSEVNSGLEAGERVAFAPPEGLTDGDRVSVKP